jgi:choline dehydrogenase-like flavoprotein
MILDANQLTEGTTPVYEICIVGAGPAGLSLAAELSKARLQICVLESGQWEKTRHADELKTILTEGDIPVKPHSRERLVGGASLTWDGLSAPFDEIDFRCRPWVPCSGWPLPLSDLQPYYERAAEDYGFPAPALYRGRHLARLRAEGDWDFKWQRLTETTLLAAAPPQRFGKMLRAIFESDRADLYTDASVTELNTREPESRSPDRQPLVTSCTVRTRSRNLLRFRARLFVVATGGIENARLLLNSTGLCAAGLGNEHDQVGRYFMNHPKNPSGIVRLKSRIEHLPAYFGCLHKGKAGYIGLRLADSEQRLRGVLNSYVRFEPLYDWSDKAGVQLLINYIKSSRRLWEKLERFKGETAVRDYAETGDDLDTKLIGEDIPTLGRLLAAMFRDAPQVAQYAFYRVFDKRVRPRVKAIRLRNFMEMEPCPENRVMLANQSDGFGKPLALVRNSATPLDRRSIIEVQKALGEELQAQGFGSLERDLTEADPWPINADASHHLGSTRMGRDPRTSVVNEDCRIHSVANLYVAGSSVFPTSGYANPTFTLVALAIRLADHLRGR